MCWKPPCARAARAAREVDLSAEGNAGSNMGLDMLGFFAVLISSSRMIKVILVWAIVGSNCVRL